MSAVPLFLSGMPVIAYAWLDAHHGPTVGAPELVRGESFVPAALAICRDADGGFYLFGCNAEWDTVTDTWHETLEDAKHQAEFQYEGVSDSWQSH